jgi:hypothetical protein
VSVPQAQVSVVAQSPSLASSYSKPAEDRAEGVQNTNGKWYNSVVKGEDFKSIIVHKGDRVEIHTTNCITGEKRVIPLMPMLANQIPGLSDARISGMVTDILNALL